MGHRADKSFRWRRGKLVQIPDEWVGQTTHPQTIRKRASKGLRKRRMRDWDPRFGPWGNLRHKHHPRNRVPRHEDPSGHRHIELEAED